MGTYATCVSKQFHRYVDDVCAHVNIRLDDELLGHDNNVASTCAASFVHIMARCSACFGDFSDDTHASHDIGTCCCCHCGKCSSVMFEREAREFQSFLFFTNNTARKSLQNLRSNTNSIVT